MGLSLTALSSLGARWSERQSRLVIACVPVGVATYYAAGVVVSAADFGLKRPSRSHSS